MGRSCDICYDVNNALNTDPWLQCPRCTKYCCNICAARVKAAVTGTETEGYCVMCRTCVWATTRREVPLDDPSMTIAKPCTDPSCSAAATTERHPCTLCSVRDPVIHILCPCGAHICYPCWLSEVSYKAVLANIDTYPARLAGVHRNNDSIDDDG